jgi:hypothetical protein
MTATKRTVRLEAIGDRVTIRMQIVRGHKTMQHGYSLRPFKAQFGRGFHLEKLTTERTEGEDSTYDVLIDEEYGLHQCCCKGFQKWGHCKHVEALVALLNAGKL